MAVALYVTDEASMSSAVAGVIEKAGPIHIGPLNERDLR